MYQINQTKKRKELQFWIVDECDQPAIYSDRYAHRLHFCSFGRMLMYFEGMDVLGWNSFN
jgi:hypothetical protein